MNGIAFINNKWAYSIYLRLIYILISLKTSDKYSNRKSNISGFYYSEEEPIPFFNSL